MLWGLDFAEGLQYIHAAARDDGARCEWCAGSDTDAGAASEARSAYRKIRAKWLEPTEPERS